MFKGLRKYEVERILVERLESDPDLKYYLNDESIIKIINLLVEGVSEAIDRNNKALDDNFRRESRYW